MIQTLSNWVCYLTNTAKPIYHASNTCPAGTQLLSQLDCIGPRDSCQPSCLGQGYNSSHSWPEELQQEDHLEKKTHMRKMDLFHPAICPLWVLTDGAADLIAAPALLPWLFLQGQKPIVNGPGKLSPGVCCTYSFVIYSCLRIFH